jgi:hypothetical protein
MVQITHCNIQPISYNRIETFQIQENSCNGIGTFQTQDNFDVECNGTSCSIIGDISHDTYEEIIAIPRKTFTTDARYVCIVNCSDSNVYWNNDIPTITYNPNILILPKSAYAYQLPEYYLGFVVTYSFFDSP